jgi:hypothetical protein
MQVRFEELPNIYNKFEMAYSELELFDAVDHLADRQQFEDEYFAVKSKFNELLHPNVGLPLSRQFLAQQFINTFTCLTQFTS